MSPPTIEELTTQVREQAEAYAARVLRPDQAALHTNGDGPAQEESPVEPSRDAVPKSNREWALHHAAQGHFVFPITPNEKAPPLIKNFPENASPDRDEITEWWTEHPNANIGISTSRYKEDHAVLVVDCDGPEGAKNWVALQLEHGAAPDTFEVQTPQGSHAYFVVPHAVKQSASKLAPHVDIRSQGGYVLGVGSVVNGKPYVVRHDRPIAPAPDWLIALCGKPKEKPAKDASAVPLVAIHSESARAHATHWVTFDAPVAVDGEAGNTTTYQVAAQCKDFGLTEAETFETMLEHYNPRCQGPWIPDELNTIVRNAFTYGKHPIGSAAPEVAFIEPPAEVPADAALSPLDQLALTYTVANIAGSVHIIQRYIDATGQEQHNHLSATDFKTWLKPQTLTSEDRTLQLADLFLKWKKRPEVDEIGFWPGEERGKRAFNVWRGLAVKPAATADHPAVKSWLEHTENNVCQGDRTLFLWLVSWCAHLFQKPGEKILVALALLGSKGIGKNIWLEILGHLLGVHFLVTANRRYLHSNFNSHLERNLLLGLDEVVWGGDRQLEGILKDLITGREHVIERKGHEPYTVANKTRVVILSNSEWAIPASFDERRFAAFAVGESRKNDRVFFGSMLRGMQSGGYEALLRYLLDWDLDLYGVDLNAAPATIGLQGQKDRSLDPLPEWWLNSLIAGTLLCAPFEGWPLTISCEDFRAAFRHHLKERNVSGRIPTEDSIGKSLKRFAPGIRKRQLSSEGRPRGYDLPSLDQARAEWDNFMPPARKWSEEGY